jgi:hypothetical protein
MTSKLTTPLAKKYQRLIDQGLISPVEEPDTFEYPSTLQEVPSVTTSDVGMPAPGGDGAVWPIGVKY